MRFDDLGLVPVMQYLAENAREEYKGVHKVLYSLRAIKEPHMAKEKAFLAELNSVKVFLIQTHIFITILLLFICLCNSLCYFPFVVIPS